ncbi:MAG: cation:proton antiporter [Chloracidobacterium sp.]|nr:cation:proton antiporter [Chloracidobacterium sp.]
MFDFKLLIAQVATILIVARLIGWLFRRLHQPRVVGEMVAGILLGPTLLGWAAPGISAALFPPASLGYLNALSQIGLLFFMFLVGLELDLEQLRKLGRAATTTSLASVITPFILGFLFAIYLYPRLSDRSVSFIGFALFMSIAMSITAFPVLARILTERNLLRSKVGSVAITCAAVDDVTAWIVLAGIIVLIRSSNHQTPSWAPLWMTLAGLGAFVLAMLVVVRRALQTLVVFYERQGGLTHDILAVVLLLVMASGWMTEFLGVHALFGAFLAGAIMPRHHDLSRELWRRCETLIVTLLLPLFFAFTGLRSSFFLISGARMWFYCAMIIALAIIGKLLGSMIAARINGMSWREATTVGVLMNTRGLVELVILNIGLDLGVLSSALFSIMVLMALVTTFMTSPLLSWIYPESHQLKLQDAKLANI